LEIRNRKSLNVASRNSQWYHVTADCSRAKTSAPQNLLHGEEARAGREKHAGCLAL
jgi:hypothetical protein